MPLIRELWLELHDHQPLPCSLHQIIAMLDDSRSVVSSRVPRRVSCTQGHLLVLVRFGLGERIKLEKSRQWLQRFRQFLVGNGSHYLSAVGHLLRIKGLQPASGKAWGWQRLCSGKDREVA